ncbi:MAG: sugar transferase [Cohaesibacter sp.]|jgi:lipopolysaccharide/colanic/teichoic acid biosynthesis glycosyltransferase|nr:sugar transferase [Cohaesibacter sp.]
MRRVVDIGIALFVLIVFSPLLLVLVVLVRMKLGNPILFKHRRTGLHGKDFILYKFRSMTDATDQNGNRLPDAARLTRFGKFLRATSLDELPGFFNILIGDMTLIGPRPQDSNFMKRCTPEQFRRHDITPSMTGWAQVNGRNTISWEERFALDLWYIVNRSVLLDFKILALTIYVILQRQGISAQGHATMPEFTPPSPRLEAAE